MKRTMFFIINISIFLIIFSCKKENKDPTPSNNLGNGWEIISVINDTPLLDIAFLNENIGYTSTANNIYKTVDGGKTWRSTNFNHSWIRGARELNTYQDKYLYVTSGSESFLISQDSVIWNFDLNDAFISHVIFISKDTGFAVGSQGLRKCVDGGHYWNRFIPKNNYRVRSSMQLKTNYSGIAIIDSIYHFNGKNDTYKTKYKSKVESNSVDFPSEKVIYFTNMSGLYKSIDSGYNYKKILTYNSSNSRFTDSYFFSESEGFVSYEHFIRKTSNGGNSWDYIIDTRTNVFKVFFLNPNLGWACTTGGQVLRYNK